MSAVVDDRPSLAVLERAWRRPETWGVAVGLAVIVVSRWLAVGTPTARMLGGGIVAVALVATVVGASLVRARTLTAAAVLLASAATVLAASADGRWQGLVALVAMALAAWSDRRRAAIALALTGIGGIVLWWRAGFDRGDAPGPSWRELAGGTGSVVRRALSSVGGDELLIPLSGTLSWWLGVGLVVGAALTAGRIGSAAWVPAALAMFVVTTWAIELWRGSVDPLGGSWIVATGVVLATVPSRDDDAATIRTAATVAGTAGLVMAIAVVREVRTESAIAAVLAVLGALVVGVALVLPRVRISDRADA